MSDQRQLAKEFETIAALLEISGANAFRVSATKKVARVLQDFEGDLRGAAAEPGVLESQDGIGKSSAEKIRQWCDTGRIDELEALRSDIPAGLIGLLDISGLGPKTVGRLWRETDIVDRAGLARGIEDGTLASLPRMGAKTIANIKDSLEFAQHAAERTSIGVALPLAELLLEELGGLPGVNTIEYAGSLRRGCETIGDIDLLATCDDPAPLLKTFTQATGVTKVLASGDTKASVRLRDGIQVDLRIINAAAIGAARLYFTGSKEHNVALRHLAQSRSLRLNEYGLFPDDGEQEPPQHRGIAPIAAATEEDIYTALNLPVHPPELREEWEAIDTLRPNLLTHADIVSDLHTHTTASDGHLSIASMAEQAMQRGYHTLAITDHSRSSVQANGLSVDRLMEHIAAIREVDAATPGIRLLAGSEVDIHADGSLDYDEDVLRMLDIVVVSPHAALRQPPEDATARLIAAVSHPHVHVLGHPTGRMIGRRPGLEPDMRAVATAAAEYGTALEINANPKRLDLRDRHVRIALECGALISINTDAHAAAHFDFMGYGVLTGRRGALTAEQCVNTWDADRLLAWLD
ncbi:MAG: DNA polymerase/3'-5' exonuclease PolX [Phycisphaerales bacterium]|jgi:DNA polymerase (family 10)|nr:DNA polymerase/3'-5' exonuclease PolX [Phycisphaerales bacterium]